MPKKLTSSEEVSFAEGRKGRVSVLDCVVASLRPAESAGTWPSKTFEELRNSVSASLGYFVSNSTVRSTVYGHADLFEKASMDGRLRWHLSKTARKRLEE
jgi:hypothetical protein